MTQFVRFAGCNMRCPGWPCDTQFAIEPSLYRDKIIHLEPEDVLRNIRDQLFKSGAMNVCLTGGEPFMQKDEDLHKVVKGLRSSSMDVEVFTNGSFPLPDWAVDLMGIIMDWKLPGSGEYETNVATRYDNAFKLNRTDAIKFVVKNDLDLETARQLTYDLSQRGVNSMWYTGRVWDGEVTDQEIVEYTLMHDLPWRLNVQIHKHIWNPEQRGV